MITAQEAAKLTGRDVYGSNGEKIGTVGHVWDDAGGAPAWASLKTGMFGGKESMVPLADANLRRGRVTVPFDRSQVKDAPRIDASSTKPLAADEFAKLHDYYGMPGAGMAGGGTRGGSMATTGAGYTADDVIADSTAAGPVDSIAGLADSTSGPADSAASGEFLTRAEERLSVGTEREPIGHAHLRKYVVTEEQQITVPISHEEVRLVREPIAEGDWAAAASGMDLGESEVDIELYGEHAVISKETVPIERVRMVKETVTEQQTVRGEIRREHIEAALPNEQKMELD